MTSELFAEDALALLTNGKITKAVSALEAGARANDVDSLFQLALWYLSGTGVVRDIRKARDILRRAVSIGHVDAALMEIALTANGSGGEIDWPRALALLKTAAEGDAVAAQQLALVGAMALNVEGFPRVLPAGQKLSQSPHIVHFRAFLTPEECAHVAQAAAPLLSPSEIVDPETGALRQHPIRTSDDAVIGPAREDLVIGAINRRIAAVSDSVPAQGEALTILHYAPGQQYRLHHDALPGVVNQRIRTVIVYLNEGFGGGETHFPAGNLNITPKGGDAIMFDNCTADGSIDPLARHAGLPVTTGSKWIATRWIRARPLDLWNLT
jgi:prolyl 4-hydroxylase